MAPIMIPIVALITVLVAMVSKVNLVESNQKKWWLDTRATRYVYLDKGMFTSLKQIMNSKKLFMGNSTMSEIKEYGMVILEMIDSK